ncbi:hypothetical protein [Bacillus sp. 1NLA3E]|uniref:hypothetical protein n=1 Tax=Bacillus sp. 1NLA3E TaxID=666686 RepID=UPI000247E856|nr:hypothetical protein [Bacillus sp. 1NLA3E]
MSNSSKETEGLTIIINQFIGENRVRLNSSSNSSNLLLDFLDKMKDFKPHEHDQEEITGSSDRNRRKNKWDNKQHHHIDDFYSTHNYRHFCNCGCSHNSYDRHDQHGHDRSCYHQQGFISKGCCHIPFTFPRKHCFNNHFRLRLAGLTDNLNFQMLKHHDCDDRKHPPDQEESRSSD